MNGATQYFRGLAVVVLLGGFAATARAQPTMLSDSAVFPALTFYELIRQYHPIVKQANLFGDEAQAVLTQARGAFDPKLTSYYDRKEFGSDLYFDHWRNKLAVPIWAGGIDLTISYDRNNPAGQYINPEERTPDSGLSGVGISVPIGQGLFIDDRRNTVRQARLTLDLARADRLKQVNKILFDAAKTYWEWYLAAQQRLFLTEGYDLANQRFEALRQRSLLGDAAIIDTTEALITVQDRLVQRQQADVDELNARLRVSLFLWNEASQPVELPATARPQPPAITPPDTMALDLLLSQATERHPDLLKLNVKNQQLLLEERFRRALIQPQLNLNAMLLSETPRIDQPYNWSSYYAFRPQNYKISVDFVFPLFLRKERGKLREVQIKNRQVVLEQQQVGRDIGNTVRVAYNQLQAFAQQSAVQQQVIRNQERLVRAEQQKFDIGESSLFLVNSRETKLIDLRIKGEELKTKFKKAVAELYYVAGTAQ